MELLQVMSSNIKQLEYDIGKQLLIITYYNKNKGTTSRYDYYDVPSHVWRQIKEFKGSYGSFIRRIIKGYKYKKIT